MHSESYIHLQGMACSLIETIQVHMQKPTPIAEFSSQSRCCQDAGHPSC